jgi:hypothetical protein
MVQSLRSSLSCHAETKRPVAALDYEIAQEMASALGRIGRTLEKRLRELAEFDAAHPEIARSREAQAARRELTVEAARALWQFIVQREACGLRDSRQVMRDYRVPSEVRDRMGAFP